MISHQFLQITLFIIVLLAPIGVFGSVDNITVPKGFQIEEYASGLGSPRFMAMSPDNVLFVTIIVDGTVVALPDRNKDGNLMNP